MVHQQGSNEMTKLEAFQIANRFNKAAQKSGIALGTATMAHPVVRDFREGWIVVFPGKPA